MFTLEQIKQAYDSKNRGWLAIYIKELMQLGIKGYDS
jgi:hypothetical protein